MSNIVRDITEIARCGAQYRSRAMASMELKGCHASYLEEICACPGISQDRLAERICVNKSNVGRQATALEEGGFITRVPCDQDRRVLRLYPTEKTLALLPEIRSVLDRWSGHLTGELSAEEAELLSVLLEKMKRRAVQWMEAD